MKARYLLIPSLAVILAVAGCTTGRTYTVDALARSGQLEPPPPAAFTILSSDEEVATDSLRFAEVSLFVSRALEARGYYRASGRVEPDFVVTVSTSVSEPKTAYRTRSRPIYGYVGGFYETYTYPVKGKDGKTYYKSSLVYQPYRHKYLGTDYYQEAFKVYEKQIEITALEPGTAGTDARELWTVAISREDSESDLRTALPYMVAAAYNYLGGQTIGEQKVRVAEDDPILGFILTGTETVSNAP